MTGQEVQARGAHLVGSVPLADCGEVLTAAGEILGDRLRRVPDGETGVRSGWIGWQLGMLESEPQLEAMPTPASEYGTAGQVRLRQGIDPAEVHFDNIGYADAALQSYKEFERLQVEGVLPGRMRFQVSLPTPLAVVSRFVQQSDLPAVEPAYERAMLAEMQRILDAIPHENLALQWDVAVEVAMLEGVMPTHLADPRTEIIDRLIRLGNAVPPAAELGYHLCYGDANHQHFKQPEDLSLLVWMANELSSRVTRLINWLHMPVPRDRDDDPYFAPLLDLRIHPRTELYLGLVHLTDGVDGARRRAEAAGRAIGSFGVATECGMGRRPESSVRPLLEIHAAVSSPLEER